MLFLLDQSPSQEQLPRQDLQGQSLIQLPAFCASLPIIEIKLLLFFPVIFIFYTFSLSSFALFDSAYKKVFSPFGNISFLVSVLCSPENRNDVNMNDIGYFIIV